MEKIKFVSLEEFGRAFIPAGVRPKLRSYLMKAGISQVNYTLFGGLFMLALIVSIVLYWMFAMPFLQTKAIGLAGSLIFMGFGTFIFISVTILAFSGIFISFIYLYLDVKIYNRTKEIENILPEFLQFVAGNLKGGMSFDQALWSSIKPRFGVLANEIEIAAKKVMTGGDVDEALTEFTHKYDSPMLKRSFDLIVEGMRGGGTIVDLIDKVTENINESQILKKEMAASVMSYVIFISFIVILVAPGLFALSFQLLNIVETFGSKLGESASGSSGGMSMPIKFSGEGMDKASFKNFSFASLGIIAFFSSLILSVIRRGDIRGGLKMVPVFVVLSLLNYKILTDVLGSVFAFML